MVATCGVGTGILGCGTCRGAAAAVGSIQEYHVSSSASVTRTWPGVNGGAGSELSSGTSRSSLTRNSSRLDAATSGPTSAHSERFTAGRGLLRKRRVMGDTMCGGWQQHLDSAVRISSRVSGGSRGAQCLRVRGSLAQSRAGVDREEGTGVGTTAMADDVNELLLADITEWELDFCSRPILDARGKRVWELLVCDKTRKLEFAEFIPNNKVNSANLKDILSRIMRDYKLNKPIKVRFFRSQMQTIISKACSELDIQPVPSQRCVTLLRWIDERLEKVYKQHPGYQEGATSLLMLDPQMPQDLPETLRGEKWAFVQLPLKDLEEEMMAVSRGQVFGSVYDLDALGIDLAPNAVIPGVAVASRRATALAAYTSALELSSLKVDERTACVLLHTNVSERWRYAFYKKNKQADEEARAWEESKAQCHGLHFLAVQSDFESDGCAGFWLLLDVEPPQI